jgi:hypothetical protein
MLVEPTPVRPPRNRWLALGTVALALIAVVVAAGLATRGTARAPEQAAAVSPASAVATSSVPAQDRTAVARVADLHGTVVANALAGSGSVLAFWGSVPTQFSWATVDVMEGDRRLTGAAVRVTAEGSFGGTLDLGLLGTNIDRVVVSLSGLNDVQLFAVPLLTTAIGGPTLRPIARDGRSSRSR